MTPESLYKSFFENTLDGLAYCQMLFDQRGEPVDFRYVRVNKNFEKLTGLHKVVGKKATEVLPGIMVSNPELLEMYGKVSLYGNPKRFETHIETLSKWFLISAYRPKKNFFMAVFQNITDRKNIEQNLENAKIAARNVLEDLEEERDRVQKIAAELEKFKLAVVSASEHVVITDPDGLILFANPATEQITGFTQGEILGKKAGVKDLWGGLMDAEFYRALWHTIKVDKHSFSGEMKNHRKDGTEYYAHSTISPILDSRGEVEFFVSLEWDITKEKAVDRAKTEFVSLASHQLRTPLSSVRWYAEMLLDGDVGAVSDSQKKYIEEIKHSNLRMIELVNTLLNVSRLELGTVKVTAGPIDLLQVVREVLVDLELRRQKKEVEVKVTMSPSLLPLMTDAGLMRIVVENVLSNAIKYTRPHGTVVVEARDLALGETFGGRVADAKSIACSVADNGIGIPLGQQDQIFKKLFRADNAQEIETDGTGLGLYLTKLAVERMHAQIWFTSRPGEGTTFYILLPYDGLQKSYER